MRLFLPLLACLTLTACITSPDRCEVRPSDPATETFAPTLGVDIASMTKTDLGDYTQDVVVGDGATLGEPDFVTIRYSTFLASGTKIDEVTDPPLPIDLRFQSTLGLADGMIGMSVGGQRLIVVPSALGLGACDNGPIPGNSTLVYMVELLSIGVQ